jgi:hypothetical protein
MTTNNSVNSGLSGTTGTGNFVGSTSPTLITPILGAATATSLAFSPTTGGIIGTTAADNATAGDVGEYISSQILFANRITFTSGTPTDLTSITLSAGDWSVGGIFAANSTTALTVLNCWTNTTSATEPDFSLTTSVSPVATSQVLKLPVTTFRYNVSGSTIVYLSGTITGTATLAAYGYIWARRMR